LVISEEKARTIVEKIKDLEHISNISKVLDLCKALNPG